jgi:exodeoxyribonuclease-3
VWTYWDYQAGAWQKDHGFRIDHALLSPELADRLWHAAWRRIVAGKKPATMRPSGSKFAINY